MRRDYLENLAVPRVVASRDEDRTRNTPENQFENLVENQIENRFRPQRCASTRYAADSQYNTLDLVLGKVLGVVLGTCAAPIERTSSTKDVSEASPENQFENLAENHIGMLVRPERRFLFDNIAAPDPALSNWFSARFSL